MSQGLNDLELHIFAARSAAATFSEDMMACTNFLFRLVLSLSCRS